METEELVRVRQKLEKKTTQKPRRKSFQKGERSVATNTPKVTERRDDLANRTAEHRRSSFSAATRTETYCRQEVPECPTKSRSVAEKVKCYLFESS